MNNFLDGIKSSTPKKKKTKKKPLSKYNLFMKNELNRLKKERPDMEHKDRFKLAAKNYQDQKT